MRRVMIIAGLASVVAGCAGRYEPQKTAGSTPTSERLKLERLLAKERDRSMAVVTGGAAVATVLGLRRPDAVAPAGPGRGDPLRVGDLRHTDVGSVPLNPYRSAAQGPELPPGTVPLVVKLPPDLR